MSGDALGDDSGEPDGDAVAVSEGDAAGEGDGFCAARAAVPSRNTVAIAASKADRTRLLLKIRIQTSADVW
jgi:hypothetical protein